MLLASPLVLFPALMAFAAASDLLTMTIPNRLSLALVIGFVCLAFVGGLPLATLGMHAAAAVVVLAIGFGLFSFGWIGGGDAKLAAATALWLGFAPLPEYLVIASIGGGLLSVLILLLRSMPMPLFALRWAWFARLVDPKSGVPYGIALAFAALIIYPDTPIWAALASG